MFIFQVDFGCVSGILLDSLLEHGSVLEEIITAGIARKGLIGEAEHLQQKLSKKSSTQTSVHFDQLCSIYDGSTQVT
ncbi:hypothetical protein PAHAL_2G034100 [Panicum hallii]|uniref:Uncharacterized protein n=1 Tax=Panicum hallii TaxID=206008 RepID=A0A2S3GVN1_9POAL|nr:hypothetical protein PAHAL_2G034100 [Panicum hallii]